ncbi:uncharacterized protein LOC132193881 [Neocloeon triangulifer]|uniref:uncharacterized protein LOC132193881 n=1 Tax=Neocloeon triangulifer TaxID=2078957 RepID=UPI00286F3353|nr:uncharacterized protein LOC132193881 [Neocloeon triangulifer]
MVLVGGYEDPSDTPAIRLTDYKLQVHPVAKTVSFSEPFAVLKTCVPFGPARFNLTESEFFDFQADNTDAAIIYFEGNSLKSKSTTVKDSTICNLYSEFGACITQDETIDICKMYYTDSYYYPTFVREPALVVNGRVQGTMLDPSCNEYDDNSNKGWFYRISAFRTDILSMPEVIIDNP